MSGTDGVGTKAAVAQAVGRFDTVGIDLVAMCVDDLVCQGAEPLFLLDYISTGSVDPARMADLVSGVAEGCRQVGAALLGGEMAEHAGIMAADEFDLVGFAVGVVEQDEILGPDRVPARGRADGAAVAGSPVERLHVGPPCPARAGRPRLRRPGLAGGGHLGGRRAPAAVGDLHPGRAGGPRAAADVHAVAHITGGGFPGNVPRALPEGNRAVVDRGSWAIPPIFAEIRRLGHGRRRRDGPGVQPRARDGAWWCRRPV